MLFEDIIETKTYVITPVTIDEISEKIAEFCNGLKIERKTVSAYRIATEESLSIWLKEFGENTDLF